MTSREIIRRVIRHDAPPRLGYNFLDPNYDDILNVNFIRLTRPDTDAFDEWGQYPTLRERTGFHGEMRMDSFGNIYGRLGGRTKGECVRGALQQGWEAFADYQFPVIDRAYVQSMRALHAEASAKYVLVGLPVAVFSVLRDLRRMDNALMDTVAQPDRVAEFLERLTRLAVETVSVAADCGADGVIVADDWGMQFSPFISPKSFKALYKPAYKAITDACHERGIDFILHSCGCVLPLVDDMIDAGIDVFQFDQPEASGSALWAREYGRKAAFYCPVDIQKIMVTGDRALIERTAIHMAQCFKASGGALIAKDYPSWGDIGVDITWAKWAMDAIVSHSHL